MRAFAQEQSQPQRRSALNSIKIQPKLRVNTTGDAYEQEADRIADRVMRMPDSQLQRTCPCGGGCPKCQAKGQDHESGRLSGQGKVGSDAASAVPLSVHEVLRSSGRPLDVSTRELMEPRFGHDFSFVRVHADAQAAKSAQAMNALAFTVGHDIVFDAGQYSPKTMHGQRLLAHELTHVVQQAPAPRKAQVTPSARSLTGNVTDGIGAGLTPSPTKVSGNVALQRQIDAGASDEQHTPAAGPASSPRTAVDAKCRNVGSGGCNRRAGTKRCSYGCDNGTSCSDMNISCGPGNWDPACPAHSYQDC
jgi:hypothetical protein